MNETHVIATPINQEDPAHIEAMVARAEGREVETSTTPAVPETQQVERPEGLPEKFKSVEDLIKAYTALEAKQSGKQPETPEATPTAPEAPAEETSSEQAGTDEAKDALKSAGLDINEFYTEFDDAGALSEESYQKLAAAGFPKALVDQTIAGRLAMQQSYDRDIKSAVGGDEGWNAMAAWATNNVDAAELEAFNEAMASGKPQLAKLAVQALNQRYLEANPDEGTLVTGANGRVTGDVYEDRYQVQADMSNPEYKKSPAFRQKVQDKIARSTVL